MKITEQELGKLLELYRSAENAPVIAMSVQEGLEGKDWATQAWNKVRDYMDELGMKYGYEPGQCAIHPQTGEIIPHEG